MSHIHTKPGQHDHTASAFILRLDFSEPKLLLHKHRLLDKYLQFGGHIELDETPWQAVVREIKEESGYDISQLKILQPKLRLKHVSGAKLHPYPVSVNTHNFNETHFHTDLEYAFVCSEEPKNKVSDDESHDFQLLTRDELNKLSDDETYSNVREIGLFIFDNVLREWEKVSAQQFNL